MTEPGQFRWTTNPFTGGRSLCVHVPDPSTETGFALVRCRIANGWDGNEDAPTIAGEIVTPHGRWNIRDGKLIRADGGEEPPTPAKAGMLRADAIKNEDDLTMDKTKFTISLSVVLKHRPGETITRKALAQFLREHIERAKGPQFSVERAVVRDVDKD